MNYVNVGYDSTNYNAIISGKGYILIEVGMPGTMKKLVYSLNKKGINVKDISHMGGTKTLNGFWCLFLNMEVR